MKNGIISFKDGRIRDAAMDDTLETNFGRGGMKKLMEDRLKRSSSSCGKETKTYTIETDQGMVKSSSQVTREVMVRRAKAIRKLTGWSDPIEASIIKAYLSKEDEYKEPEDASVEVKRGRADKEEGVEEPSSKKKAPNAKETSPKEGQAHRTR